MERKINLLAVFVAAAVHWVFGAVWFTLFANQWMAGLGMTQAQFAAAKAHPSPVPYLIAFICNFGFAVVIARMISFTNMRSALGGARIGMMLGFGVAMLPMMTEYFFEMKSLNFALIAGTYPAVGGIIMGTILGAWQKRGAVVLASKAAA
jgi:Protein of unknown function (DUF1761)